MSEDPDWKCFEKAVAEFVQRLDPSAKVDHDLRLPDKHHGGPRQRDVWIEGKLVGHFPVKALVSCKRYGRPLNSQDVDHFNGELFSSGAQLGVIYSYNGFGDRALEKATQLGISCCRLFQDQAPEVPEFLLFPSFACQISQKIRFSGLPCPGWEDQIWKEVFDLEIDEEGESHHLLEYLEAAYRLEEARVVKEIDRKSLIPDSVRVGRKVPSPTVSDRYFEVFLLGEWELFQGNLAAHRIDGSYELTSGDFKGRITGPSIDRHDPELGENWTRIDAPPKGTRGAIVMVLSNSLPVTAIRETIGPYQVGTFPSPQ